jgi:hypothetical protein
MAEQNLGQQSVMTRIKASSSSPSVVQREMSNDIWPLRFRLAVVPSHPFRDGLCGNSNRPQGTVSPFLSWMWAAARNYTNVHAISIRQSKRRISTVLAGVVLLFGCLGAKAAPSVGMNLEGISDYSVSMLFADIVKQSRHWGTAATPWDQAATVDSNGWPTTDAGIVLSYEPNTILCTYKLVFTGQAVVTPTGGSSLTVENQVYSTATNITTADVVVTAGSIDLSFTNTRRTPTSGADTGVTNVQLYRPGYPSYGSVLFTTPVESALEEFTVIRFMDIAQTNGNQQVNWSDRRLPSYASQCAAGLDGGLAWEYVVALCNATGRDAYINIPEHATDSYITNLALLFKNGDTVNGVTYSGLAPN